MLQHCGEIDGFHPDKMQMRESHQSTQGRVDSTPIHADRTHQILAQAGGGVPPCGSSHPCQQQSVKEVVQHGYTHKSFKRATDDPSKKGRKYGEVRWVS